jgi:hypothetical protein
MTTPFLPVQLIIGESPDLYNETENMRDRMRTPFKTFQFLKGLGTLQLLPHLCPMFVLNPYK